MNDLRGQLAQMRRMGGLGALAGMIPGMKKAQAAMASGAVDDKILIHMDAMIGSMTHKEQIGRAHVGNPVTNAHLVCRHMLEKKTTHTRKQKKRIRKTKNTKN